MYPGCRAFRSFPELPGSKQLLSSFGELDTFCSTTNVLLCLLCGWGFMHQITRAWSIPNIWTIHMKQNSNTKLLNVGWSIDEWLFVQVTSLSFRNVSRFEMWSNISTDPQWMCSFILGWETTHGMVCLSTEWYTKEPPERSQQVRSQWGELLW